MIAPKAAYEIRPLNAAGMNLVVELARRIWPAAYGGNLSPAQIENLLARIYCPDNLAREIAAGHRFWAAFDGATPLGFASGYREDDVVWLKKLYVLPEMHGRGIGRALMQTVIDAFAPAREIRLFVNGGNRAAQAFYERCGFRRVASVPVQMGDYQFQDFIYAKPLPSAPV